MRIARIANSGGGVLTGTITLESGGFAELPRLGVASSWGVTTDGGVGLIT